MVERLQKLLSRRGVASRRQAEQLIIDGRVTVNGKLAELGQRADALVDVIRVDGVQVDSPPERVYLLLHKPKGVVSTCHDPRGRKTVLDLLNPDLKNGMGVHPVGRLDANSTGALLLTNDGDLTYWLTHPRHQMPKVYRVWVEGSPSKKALARWREGLDLDGRKTMPAKVHYLRSKCDRKGHTRTLLEITLREGRNRQIRRVAEILGHSVTDLHRTKIGSLALSDLPRGRYRLLSPEEVARLQHKETS